MIFQKPILKYFIYKSLIGVLDKHRNDGSKQAIIGIPYPVVFLVNAPGAPPRPLKPELAPLPPDYYDPNPDIRHLELQDLPAKMGKKALTF